MKSRDFCYWFQGYLELSQPVSIDAVKTEIIKRHLNMVFEHEIDPSHGDEEHQKKLKEIHKGKSLAEQLTGFSKDKIEEILKSGIEEDKIQTGGATLTSPFEAKMNC